MDTEQTHYETLNITRNAPDFLIRAAFKSLSQKYHPDVNPDVEDAHAKMVAINYAYQTLADEEKRKAYDVWLDRQKPPSNSRSGVVPKGRSPFDRRLKPTRQSWSHWSSLGAIINICCLAFISLFFLDDPSVAQLRTFAKEALQQGFFRVESSPYASALRVESPGTGYLKGYRQQSLTGKHSVLFSNRSNNFDINARLVGPKRDATNIIRFFRIKKNESFLVSGLDDLYYEVRFHHVEADAFRFVPLDLTEKGEFFVSAEAPKIVDLSRSFPLAEANYFLSTPAETFYGETPLLEKLAKTISGEVDRYAPNGQPLPRPSGLISGYRQVKTGGYNQMVVRNGDTQNSMFAILELDSNDQLIRTRTFHVGPGSELLLDGLEQGFYRFRYQYVSAREAFLTSSFRLEGAGATKVNSHKISRKPIVIDQLSRAEAASLY